MVRTEIPGKFTPERTEIARQIARSRWFDSYREKGQYTSDAHIPTYVHRLNGLSGYFDHIRNFEGEKIVFDIGSGTTRGIAEIAKSEMGRDIDFRATVLRNMKKISGAASLGPGKVFKTSVERLTGIEDGSVSGIISNSGLAYSIEPEITVDSIDRVLRPGGVVKADFEIDDGEKRSDRPYTYRRSYRRFAKRFSELGYDIAFEFRGGVVLLAIKPGSSSDVTAVELLRSDEAVKGLREKLSRGGNIEILP